MAEKQASAQKPAEPKDDEGTEEAPVFPVEELVAHARSMFGASPHIVAGALSKGNRKNYSEAEAAQRVQEFAEAPIV